jgi:hypothetical protein
MFRLTLLVSFGAVAAACLWASSAHAQQYERRHAENELLARPAVRITVGLADADLVGRDNRALQAAVDYVAALGGGTVEIGPGEYLMRDSLHLRPRVTVRGAGDKTVLKKDAAVVSPLAADGDFGEEAITLVEPAGFELGRGVYIGSNRASGFHGVCATLLNSKDNYFTLSRSLMSDYMVGDKAFAATVFPVISAYYAPDVRIENLTIDGNRAQNPLKIDGCRTAGIFCYQADGAVIERCTVRGYNGDGISFQQSNDVRVTDCTVEDCAGHGLHPGSGSQRPTVVACRATRSGDDGLFFCWRVRGGVAENNQLEGNFGHGLSIGHKDSDNLIRGNLIAGNGRGGVLWRDEAEPMAAHRVTFEKNTVRDNERFGVHISGQTTGAVLRENTIDAGKGGRQVVGVRIGPQAGEVRLEGNTIHAEQDLVDERTTNP